MTATLPPTRSIRLGARDIIVVPPSLRDPRLHLASVVITLHVLGQVGLGFDVSIAQILAAILTCAFIEVAWTFRRTEQLIWPASAMLTGSGVALIFRVVGTEHGQYWSMRGWHLFALVAGLSLVTKYVIRYRGDHVFNPSNVGLVVAFIVLGSGRTEPLDFWWAPLNGWMIAAYAVILLGGILITARLSLIEMAVSFWLTLATTIGILSISGHSITTRWSLEPVAGTHFWWIIVTSPEVLIFLFFMITDPKTAPEGRVGRILFAVVVAVVCTLLIAPQGTEFGAKVALLGGLTLVSPTRTLFDRLSPAAGTESDRLDRFASTLVAGGADTRGPWPIVRGLVAVCSLAVVGAAVVLAGSPARESARDITVEALPEIDVRVDASALPPLTVGDEVAELSSKLAGPESREVALSLLENLLVESRALASADRELLEAVDYGYRLEEMQLALDDSIDTGSRSITSYRFDSMHMTIGYPFGEQGGPSPAFEARGSMDVITYDATGSEVERTTAPCDIMFTLIDAGDGRWLTVEAVPIG